ncbi:MAG: citrate transporter [Deltaproteobacteria bacterium RIFOXYD12_FULL_57_12]|nr:MAG: citrate transporter [Deltaproteobacteria bacterium RIFOXYD12_FULL_57_12]
MRTPKIVIPLIISLALFFIGSLAFASGGGGKKAPEKEAVENGVHMTISGTILDSHKEPVGEATVIIRENGREVAEVETAKNGHYVTDFIADEQILQGAQFELEVRKVSFTNKSIPFQSADFAHKGDRYFIAEDVSLDRELGPAFWIATVVFVLAYVLIAFELLHRTVAAMLGAALMMLISYTIGTIYPEFRIYSFERAIAAIDMNVIFLLMGMMIIVGILKNTGVFQWCAYVSYKVAKGKVFPLTVILMAFTAVTSAFLDNVTTMLLLTGVAIEIAVSCSLNPLYLLIPLVLASNVGGTATLIGDPPNIMIGSYASLTFMDFVVALALLCVVTMVVLSVFVKLVWGKAFNSAQATISNVDTFTAELKEKYKIYDMPLLTYGLVVLGFTVFLFLSHGYWHMEVCIAALAGAAILTTVAMVTKKVNLLHMIEKDIEWPTLMFFMFLFILVGAVEETGLLAVVADWILSVSGGEYLMSMTLILWVAAIMSAFVDNIPFTATMLPIVGYLSTVIPGAENTLWWALALGACFGGNGTIIGASANVVTMGIAESQGYKISFIGFMKTAFPFMIISIIICQIWLMVFKPA